MDTISGKIYGEQQFSGEIQGVQNIHSVVVDERYNGQIDIENKKSGELEDLSEVKGKIEIENCIYGIMKRPRPYIGWIDTIVVNDNSQTITVNPKTT